MEVQYIYKDLLMKVPVPMSAVFQMINPCIRNYMLLVLCTPWLGIQLRSLQGNAIWIVSPNPYRIGDRRLPICRQYSMECPVMGLMRSPFKGGTLPSCAMDIQVVSVLRNPICGLYMTISSTKVSMRAGLLVVQGIRLHAVHDQMCPSLGQRPQLGELCRRGHMTEQL